MLVSLPATLDRKQGQLRSSPESSQNMKIPPRSITPLKSDPVCPFVPITAETMTHSAVPWLPGVVTKNLMPYEAAAKTIFVKANGLPAYYKATGSFRYAR